MGYVRTHWHAMLFGAAILYGVQMFVLPRVAGMGSRGEG